MNAPWALCERGGVVLQGHVQAVARHVDVLLARAAAAVDGRGVVLGALALCLADADQHQEGDCGHASRDPICEQPPDDAEELEPAVRHVLVRGVERGVLDPQHYDANDERYGARDGRQLQPAQRGVEGGLLGARALEHAHPAQAEDEPAADVVDGQGEGKVLNSVAEGVHGEHLGAEEALERLGRRAEADGDDVEDEVRNVERREAAKAEDGGAVRVELENIAPHVHHDGERAEEEERRDEVRTVPRYGRVLSVRGKEGVSRQLQHGEEHHEAKEELVLPIGGLNHVHGGEHRQDAEEDEAGDAHVAECLGCRLIGHD
eukprot:CAMPEP_0198426794 /NCGR_PEP_ID=MMETSP1452-20131203/5479_1 /TAXON_ID=1181717 /ORGANISM="Synchroma pusillum, Strain CCMP3072" /LENGTH=317 /DNA_ID=CAMNT_0044147167 /DNA_START=51 /DNA_END=1001 /DNA_ORIENTATION=+